MIRRQTAAPVIWLVLLAALLALRVPSIVQPAGGDQGLYLYEAQRVLAGDVPYRDVWDQKPPGIAFLYAAAWRIWPHESIVPIADLLAAAGVAGLLVAIGRRRAASPHLGYAAAAVYLLFADPSIQRLSGIYVRGQCEPFIALAVTAAIATIAPDARRPGVSSPLACCSRWRSGSNTTRQRSPCRCCWRHGPGRRLIRTTPDFPESSDPSRGSPRALPSSAARFSRISPVTPRCTICGWRRSTTTSAIPTKHTSSASRASSRTRRRCCSIARGWICCGSWARLAPCSCCGTGRSDRTTFVWIGWLAAAVLSISINGHRDLPNYFVQAAPALAMACAAGFATLRGRAVWQCAAAAAVVLAGLWRVGADAPTAGLRWGGLPGVVENVQRDVGYARGRIDRAAYFGHFKGVKHDALAVDTLARHVRETTAPAETIFVFGFSGGSVGFKSGRESASRFFWSRPILIEFAASEPGYGSAGLLADLTRRKPVLVALQREQWESERFFLQQPGLRAWLEQGYVLEQDTPMFSVWRRKL